MIARDLKRNQPRPLAHALSNSIVNPTKKEIGVPSAISHVGHGDHLSNWEHKATHDLLRLGKRQSLCTIPHTKTGHVNNSRSSRSSELSSQRSLSPEMLDHPLTNLHFFCSPSLCATINLGFTCNWVRAEKCRLCRGYHVAALPCPTGTATS
jgi:hypothetical protein